MDNGVLFRPASLKQEMFINSTAFRTIYGGSMGGGKTFMGLMRFLLYVDDPNFIGFVIRKNASDLRGAGGAYDEALAMFSKYDPKLKYTKQPMPFLLCPKCSYNLYKIKESYLELDYCL